MSNQITPSHRLPTLPLQLSDSARTMGICIMAGKGSGKSRYMGRALAYNDFMRKVPLFILDPIGGTIDNLLDKINRLPRDRQPEAWERIIYVEPSGRSGSIVPFPLYYNFGRESLYTMSQRYLDILKKLDPHLIEAPVTGWNAVHRVGTMMGMALSALGCQISEGAHLLNHPEQWIPKVEEMVAVHPELREVVDSLTLFANQKGQDRQREKDMLLSKISVFALEPASRSIFGATRGGLEWHDVIDKSKCVLFDLRHIHDVERKKFLIWWFYDYFTKYVLYRGHGHHTPISFIIDELSTFVGGSSNKEQEMFADELNKLINVVSRSHRVWLTVAMQEIWQVPERVRKSLMTIGTQMIGATSDPESGKLLAEYLFRYNPMLTRKTENRYMKRDDMRMPYVVDVASTEYTYEEQLVLNSYRILNQGKFRFLVRVAKEEGDPHGDIFPLSIAHMDKGQWVDERVSLQARTYLTKLHGQPIPSILQDIEKRIDELFNAPITVKTPAPATDVVERQESAPVAKPAGPVQPPKQHTPNVGKQPQAPKQKHANGHQNGKPGNGQTAPAHQGVKITVPVPKQPVDADDFFA